mgnify:CR=1 FL=1
MKIYRYPSRALVGDYLRAGAGLTLTLAPLGLAGPGGAAVWVLGPLALLFLVFGVRTARRHIARVELSGEGISLFALRRVSVPWSGIGAVRLNYFSTKVDRRGGWMQLTLKSRGGLGARTIHIDSALDGFAEVALAASSAAAGAGVALSPASRANFEALGLKLDPPPARTAERTGSAPI